MSRSWPFPESPRSRTDHRYHRSRRHRITRRGHPGHNARVADLSVAIARELDLDQATLRVLGHAGLLHDLGKLGVPEAVLNKPSGLNDLDWALLRTHPELGSQILQQLGDMEQERLIVATQQERLDGNGYPHGLRGEAIPLEARILGAATTYESLLSQRPYRSSRSSAQTVNVLLAERGHTLDASVVDALLRLLSGRARVAQP